MNRYNRSDKPDWVPPRSNRLLDQVRERVRYLHYSLQTEKAYVYWAKAFVFWTARSGGSFRHPREMGQTDVEGFLTMLAMEKQVSPATHRQALNALLFLYRQVLGMELPWLQQIGRPPERKRIPVVLTVREVQAMLGLMTGTEALMAALLYGSGLLLREALGLRVKDVDFDRHAIVVRSGKGDKDRVVMLPKLLFPELKMQLAHARALWGQDRTSGRHGVFMPHALERKYPHAGESWAWFWVFPSLKLSVDAQTGVERRHHLYEERLGHSDVSTTMIYTHVLKVAAGGTASPLDALAMPV
jgi:integron integrase